MILSVFSKPSSESTLASRQSEANFASNLEAIRTAQPTLLPYVEGGSGLPLEWLFGRDGSLTARDASSQSPGWISQTSLPRRVAASLLRTLEVRGGVACFLAPSHAAQIRCALDKLQSRQAVIVILSDAAELPFFLRCENFAADFLAGRLWFVCGTDWAEQFRKLLVTNEGLSAPSQFIRLSITPAEVTDALIPAAQALFAEINTRRATELETLRKRPIKLPGDRRRLCVVAPTQFSLWENAAGVFASMFSSEISAENIDLVQCDPDHPASGSPVALARLASTCDAMLTANVARGDLPAMLPPGKPWITWLTTERVPAAPANTGPGDQLIVVDADVRTAAIRAGWPAGSVTVASWPAQNFTGVGVHSTANLPLAIIADTHDLATPKTLSEFSSHTLLWELVRSELTRDPLVLGFDLPKYLRQRAAKLSISEESLDAKLFIERLIIPAYQQGLARLLAAAKLPLRLYGQGWESNESLRAFATGPVNSREDLSAAIVASAALVHVWPSRHPHPVEFAGKPGVRVRTNRTETFIRDARLAIAGHGTPPEDPVAVPPLSGELLRRLI